ncbi:MAG TPA: YmaF family protein [Bacillales bacterium]|nr:YmaF family protein [Bacillales bacterium]
MGIPITGFLFCADEGSLSPNDEHSHTLYVTTWDGRQVHAHEMAGFTSFDAGHQHQYRARTETAPSGVPHNHRYYTITSINDGHEHQIQGVTGPAIPLQGGGHYHEFRGVTTISGANPHRHSYSGRTGNEIR